MATIHAHIHSPGAAGRRIRQTGALDELAGFRGILIGLVTGTLIWIGLLAVMLGLR